MMKYYFVFMCVIATFAKSHSSNSRTVEDPVARHDANECGRYLCPRYADFATAYLQAGCKTSFKDFVTEHTPTPSKTRPHTSPTGGHSKPTGQS